MLYGGGALAQTTVTQTSFTATSGNVGDDKNVSYKAEKGNANTAPAINNGVIRVYQNGGLFTVSVADGCTLTNVKLGSAMATTVTYVTDKTTTASATKSITANGTLSVDFTGGEKSVTFTCTGTTRNDRLYVNSLSVTYTSASTGKTATTLAFADPADKTFDLNATEGTTFTQTASLTPAVEGAAITYASDNESIAKVDANTGEVTVTTSTEGTATITATYAGNATYDGSTASYTITVKDPNQPQWIKTDLTALTSTDQFVIVDLTSKTAMSNDNGTSKAPTATTVTLNDDKSEIIGDVADNLKWNLSVTDGNYTFYPNGTTSTWLYVSGSSSNNNLRVGTGDDKTFTAYTSGNYSGLKGTDGTNDRYIHVYSNQDWRTYKNATQTSTSIAYFKRVSSTPDKTATKVTFEKEGNYTISQDANATDLATYTNAATVTDNAGNAISGATVTYTSSDNDHADVSATGEVTIDQTTAGTYTITATYAGDDTYAASSATYTINVKETLTLTGKGTQDDPYTVADVIKIVNANEQTKDNVYVKGIVTSVDTKNFNTKYKNINFYLSDDGTSTSTIEAFRAKNVGNTDITSTNDVAVGDNVLLYGALSKYNSTIELAQGCYIVSFGERSMEFDEDKGFTVAPGHNVKATFSRTFNANAWNTLVLPFDMTAEQVTTTFGTDVKVANFTGTTDNADGTYTLNFETNGTISANKPVFIYGANSDGIYEITGVTVVDATPTAIPANAAFTFVGNYSNATAEAGDWFISSDNNFYKANGSESIKPTRAVFRPTTTAAAAKGLKVNIDGEATGISGVTMEENGVKSTASGVYNLNGQKVAERLNASQLPSGVYIVNGKKFVRK